MSRQLQIGDIVYYGLDSVGRERATWRVNLHLKRVEETFDASVKTGDFGEDLFNEILGSLILKEKLEREEKGLPCARRFQMVGCSQEEATHVSLVGICGATAPIGECEFIRPVDWPQKLIDENAEGAKRFIGHGFGWQWE